MFKKFLITVFSASLILISVTLQPVHAAAPIAMIAARIWPAADYTRITLESNKPITNKMVMLKNPDRLVLDLEDVELGAVLKSLPDKILASDPYIKQIRTGNFKPGVVRLVIDLKSEIKPQLFSLPPAGEYQHRLVLDIYPLKDVLIAMLEQHEIDQHAKPAIDSKSSANSNPEPSKSIPPATDVDNNLPTPVAPDVVLNQDATTSASAAPAVQVPLTSPAQPEKPVPEKPISIEKSPVAEKPTSAPTTEKPVIDKTSTEKSVAEKPKDKAIDKIKTKTDGRLITVAIDAGHGGEDPGAQGANGSHEKNITLAVAKKLKEQIDAEPNMRGILTRDGDYFIPLHGRVVKARNMQADLFVSIHADAFIRPDARGSSVFALSERGATSASARYLAKKENESDLIGGVSLDDKDPNLARTLLDLSQTATISDSLKLAKAVLVSISKINNLHKGSVEQAAFAVLKSPDIPSILVETAFISNPEEEQKLNDEAYQDKLVGSILSGIKKYFASNPPLARTKVANE